MLFNKNDSGVNDRILYQTKPNMILGCKKAVYGIILLVIILMVSPMVIKFIGEMQVYLISHIKLSLTRYTAIAFFVIILINVVYIIWQLVGWFSVEYTLTETRIIIKSGIISTKRNYMPYATIQDINSNQSFFAKMLNVGTVRVFSAYDNNQLELKDISDPSKVEEIIFSRMVGPRNFQAPPQRFPQEPTFERDDYYARNEPYDEFEPITPITHERNEYHRREYEYYPEDFPARENPQHKYEYEPYDNGLSSAQNSPSRDRYYNQVLEDYSPRRDNYPPNYDSQNHYGQAMDDYPPRRDNYRQSNDSQSHYNQVMDDYSPRRDNYYPNNDSQNYYDESFDDSHQDNPADIDESSQVIRRHFDKFKK